MSTMAITNSHVPPRTVDRLCYIAGPITGYLDGNKAAFDACHAQLIAEKWLAYSPRSHERSAECLEESKALGAAFRLGPVYQALMREFFAVILHCERVWVLPGWKQAQGAVAEVQMAFQAGIPVWTWHQNEGMRGEYNGLQFATSVTGGSVFYGGD